MSNSCNTNITKYYVVQPTGNLGSITATTINADEINLSGNLINCGSGSTIFTNVISGCTGDLVINGNLFDNNGNIDVVNKITTPVIESTTFNGGSFYGDGSNLSGITDSYSTGGTYSSGIITITGLGDFSTYNIDVSDLIFTGDTTDSYVSGGTFNVSANTLTLTLTQGNPDIVIDLGPLKFTGGSGDCITDLYVTNIHGCSPITLQDDTIINGTLTINDGTQQNGYVFTSDSGGTGSWKVNPYITSGSVIGNSLVLDRTDVSSAVTIDLSSFVTDTNTYVTGGTYNGETLSLNRNDGGIVNISGIIDSYTTGLTFNNTTYELRLSRNQGLPDLTSDLSILSNDVYVLSGVYNPSTGVVTYTNSSGGTFQVSGFTTGATDTYTTDAYLNGNEIRFDNNILGNNFYQVDLTPILSAFTTTDRFVSGGTYNTLGQTIDFTGNDPITTFSVDVSNLLDDTNTFVTGSTFNRSTDTLTISRNDGVDFNVTGITDTYVTTGTVVGSDIILSRNDSENITIDVSSFFDDTNTFVTGGTYNGETLTLTRNDGQSVNVSGIIDSYVTGATLNGTVLELGRNQGLPDVTVDLLSLTLTSDRFVSGGTYNVGTQNIDFTGNDPITTFSVDVSNLLDDTNTFITGFTYTSTSNKLTISRNDGQEFNTFVNELSGLTITNDLEVIGNISGDTFYGDGSGLENVIIQFRISGDTGGFQTITNADVLHFIGGRGIRTDITFLDSVEIETSNDVPLTTDPNVTFEGTLNVENNLNVTGTTTSNYFVGDGSGLTNLNLSAATDTFITGQTFDDNTYILTTTRNDGFSINTDLGALASDVYVLSGVYNPATGIVTYTNSSGGTFEVSGFTTGMTDSYTTSSNLVGETIQFNNNILGTNLYNVSLTPVLSGKTDLTLFNLHTGDTNNPHQTSLGNLFGGSAHTHTLSEITDFDSYSGSVQTQLNNKIGDGINFGGGEEIFSGKSETDLYFRTLSGGTNTTVSTVGDLVKIDVSIPPSIDTYVTGFTYNNINTFTISRNDGVSFNSTIDILSASTISATTFYGDGSQLTGIVSEDNYVTGGTLVGNSLVLNRTDVLSAVTVDLSQFLDNTDNYVTGGTYNSGILFFSGTSNNQSFQIDVSPLLDDTNDGVVSGATISGSTLLVLERTQGLDNVTVDLSSFLDNTDNYVTGGTYSNGTLFFSGTSTNQSFQINVNDLLDNTDRFVTGATMNGNILELSRSGGLSDVTVDLSQFLDDTNDGVVSGATMNGNVLELSRTQGLGIVSVDLSQFLDDTNFYVTGSTLNGNTLELSRNGGLSTLTTDLSQFLDNTDNYVTGGTYSNGTLLFSGTSLNQSFQIDVSPLLDDTNDGVVSGATMNGNILELSRTQGLPNVTVDLSQFLDDTDNYVTGGTYNSGTLTLNRQNGSVSITGFTDNTDTFVTGTTFNLNQADLGRNDGFNVLSLSGTNDVNLTNPSSNLIVIDVNGLKYFISETVPTGVTIENGYRWFNTSIGSEFVYIDDGDSSQWVQPLIQPGPQGPSGNPDFITTGITTSTATLTTEFSYYGVNYSGNVDLTLPDPTGIDGFNFVVKDESGNAGTYRIRLIPSVGLLDGYSSVDMMNNHQSHTLVARNNNWWII